jgi:hypothetical protein
VTEIDEGGPRRVVTSHAIVGADVDQFTLNHERLP